MELRISWSGAFNRESSAAFPFQAANIFICFADLCVLCAPCFVPLCGSKFLMNLHVVFGVCEVGVWWKGKGKKKNGDGKAAGNLLPLPFLFITLPTHCALPCSALFSFHIQNTFGKYWYGRKLFKMRNTLDKLLTVKRCEALSGREQQRLKIRKSRQTFGNMRRILDYRTISIDDDKNPS